MNKFYLIHQFEDLLDSFKQSVNQIDDVIETKEVEDLLENSLQRLQNEIEVLDNIIWQNQKDEDEDEF
jgi:hypothetical protein